MSTVRVTNYLEGDRRLVDTDLVGFLRKKLDKGDILDLLDVAEVAPGILDALFDGFTPEQVETMIQGAGTTVMDALAAWIDRRAAPVTRVERPRVHPRIRRPAPLVIPPPLEREASGDERFTPTRLVQRLQSTLRGYIESAYPLSDPSLIRARRILLEQEADGHLLAQEPYIETTTRYASAPESYSELDLPPHIASLFVKLASTTTAHSTPEETRSILFPSMYQHQARAYRAFLGQGKDVVVATGTGSGKTECFLVPLLGVLHDEATRRPESFARPGVRALIMYPMNALVNDQLGRLRLLLGEPAVAAAFRALGPGRRSPRFGMYTGRTAYPGPRRTDRDSDRVKPLLEYYLAMKPALANRLKRLGRYPAKDLKSFFAEHEAEQITTKSGRPQIRHHWERRLHTSDGDRELLTRQEMVHGTGTLPGQAPDVLVTNYSMLEYMLMRPFERPIFAETRRWLAEDGAQLLLVLDEAHMYRGAKGAEVAFLIRRLRARLGIHDRPDKLRVIATSASLGGSAEARQTVRRFVADLSGKRPDDFEAITGTREVPEPAAPGTREEADLLASLDLDAINEALDGPSLRACLAPLLPQTPANPPSDEAHVLAELHTVLAGKTYVNQLVKEAAGAAQALGVLAERVFPGHPRSRRALEALLTVGTLARLRPDDPGLVPTRVHGIFRGLHGLHACINPTCHGRQADEGQPALLGKLFSAPRPSCDACGARVFEIASCRSCGSPYLLTYAEIGRLDRLSFLWGETEGALLRIELLPGQPRYSERTEELRIHLHTGYVDLDHSFPNDEVRSLHLWQDGDGRREPSFGRCAMCQPAATARARIHDFRTRGEQPFTALIEAQFAEQPPQKRDPSLPNSGRKVLVFSDGRQKAARLAPALEHSHARDLFRQVAAIAARKLQEGPGLTGLVWLYPAIVWVCADQRYNLFPFPDHTADTEDEDTRAVIEFRNQISRVTGKTLEETLQMANRSRVKPVSVYGKAIFQELTDRYYSLQSLALATVEEDPAIAYIFDNFPDVGLDDDATRVLFRAWVRQHLERRSFLPEGAGMTELGEGWGKPEGIDAAKPRHIFPNRFDEYILHVLGGDQAAAQQVLDWFQALVRSAGLLHFENDLYYLQLDGLSLNLRLDSSWLRCTDCGRIHPEVLADACPACLGKVVDADADYLDARTGFYRRQVLRAFDPRTLEPFGLAAAEHSAQLTGQPDESAFNKVEEYELRFQDIPIEGKSPIDVLSCTTTMEVGIDIGALSGVALRNVPPHVANYQQRAGRAGRRGRSIASVITYAHGTSHDAHYFDHPEQIISGEVRPPIVYIENQQVLERHIHAYLVQRFFHDRVAQDATSFALFSSLGTVEQFLSDAHACSLRKLEAWLDEHAAALQAELRGWVPAYSHGLQAPIAEVEGTIVDSIGRTRRRICDVLPIAEYARREQLIGLEREALERRLEDQLLEALIGHAVFPRYAFPTDVVTFWVSKPRGYGEAPGKRAFDYEPQRDLQLALTEYAPGRSLTIDKWRFQSAALFSPYQPTPAAIIARRQPYTACSDCTWVSMAESAASAPQCPVCGSERLTRCSFITPAGFAPDLNEPRQVDRGQPITYAGMTDRARLELQDPPGAWAAERHDGRLLSWTGPRKLAIVNKGVDERGFRVCPDCGRSEPQLGPKYTAPRLTNKAGTPTQHKHPMEKGIICAGTSKGPFFLGHRFPTDALLLRLRVDSPMRLGTPATTGLLSKASRMALTSAVEAIALAASRVLQIDEGELSGWWTPLLGGHTDTAQLYLYDLLPGGAGYARAVGDALDDVLNAAEGMLAGCNCVTSCYRCIRHYGNNWIHASLDRHLALALIQHIRTGHVPVLDEATKSSALKGLCEILRLRKHECIVDADVRGMHVPLLLKGPTGARWFDVHHPLVDPNATPSPVTLAARGRAIEFGSVDAFDLLHDLPAAVEQVLARGSAQ
jgi:ATP-dependent helicase YprA (DUF1998 family)